MTAGDSPNERVLLVVSDVDRQLAMSSFLQTADYVLSVCESHERAALEVVQSAPQLVIVDATEDAEAAGAILQRIRQQAPRSQAAFMCAVPAADSGDLERAARALG